MAVILKSSSLSRSVINKYKLCVDLMFEWPGLGVAVSTERFQVQPGNCV